MFAGMLGVLVLGQLESHRLVTTGQEYIHISKYRCNTFHCDLEIAHCYAETDGNLGEPPILFGIEYTAQSCFIKKSIMGP